MVGVSFLLGNNSNDKLIKDRSTWTKSQTVQLSSQVLLEEKQEAQAAS